MKFVPRGKDKVAKFGIQYDTAYRMTRKATYFNIVKNYLNELKL